MDRRRFLKRSVMAAAAIGTPFSLTAGNQTVSDNEAAKREPGKNSGTVIDTNVHLFCYPFRDLKYGATATLLNKLKSHNIGQAWTGSYTSLFHKNIDHVNAKLVKECRENGSGMLIPFGTVNPVFPDWEEDLRRCHELYQMPGLRLYPGYHGYTLEDESFKKLLQAAAERGMLIQVVVAMEDERMQHPLVEVPNVDVSPLPDILARVPGARVQLLHPFRHVRGDRLRSMVEETDVTFEISNLDGVAALERVMKGIHWYIPDLTIPPERLLFGSHMPYFPLENSLFKFMESPLSEEQLRLIISENAERLLAAV